MKIQLSHDEIVDAIRDYIKGQGIDPGNNVVEVALTAGRGEKGHYADVTISKTGQAPAASEASETASAETQAPEKKAPAASTAGKAEDDGKNEAPASEKPKKSGLFG